MVARWYGKQGQTPVNTQDYHVKVHGGHKMSYETLRLVKQLNISNIQEKYTFLTVSQPYVQSTPQILDMLFTNIGWSLLKQKVWKKSWGQAHLLGAEYFAMSFQVY